ncbi:MAG: hypothetical protein AB8C84_05765 [Oligoflexales bacterium]
MLFCCAFFSWPLLSSDIQDVLGQRRGIQLLNYEKQSNFWSQFESLGVDQSIETTPPGTKFFDRRVTNYFACGKDVFLGTGGLRVAIELFHQVIKKEEEQPPKSPVENKVLRLDTAVDYTFVNPKGLEIALGLHDSYSGSELEKQTSNAISSETKIEDANLYTPRIAIVKRSNQWSGSFYFRQGSGNKQRRFEKIGSDGTTIEGSSSIYIPGHYGVSGNFWAGPAKIDIDFMVVQAGEGGPESEEGIPVHGDYLDIYLRTEMTGIGVALRHRTLSYSENAFVNLDRIPYTALAIYSLLGEPGHGLRVGFLGIYGDDGQSLPEFNASYHKQGVGLFIDGIWAV